MARPFTVTEAEFNSFADFIVEAIQSEPAEVVRMIEDEDWEGLQNEFYYHFRNAAEG